MMMVMMMPSTPPAPQVPLTPQPSQGMCPPAPSETLESFDGATYEGLVVVANGECWWDDGR